MTDEQLYAMYDITNIQVLMRARRLALLSRIYETAPKDLIAMLAEIASFNSHSFVSQFFEDL